MIHINFFNDNPECITVGPFDDHAHAMAYVDSIADTLKEFGDGAGIEWTWQIVLEDSVWTPEEFKDQVEEWHEGA